MKQNLNRAALALALGTLIVTASAWAANEEKHADLIKASQDTIAMFKQEDPGLEKQLTSSAGYAVFPNIGSGGMIVGGGGGEGVLFEKGQPVGRLTLTKLTVGLTAGGKSHSELIFFENQAALDRFKHGKSQLGASASAVAAEAGASAHAKYQDGVEIFISNEKGLMHELSVGGQTFKFEPFAKGARPPAT